jgi:hypothetical protein
VVLVVSVCLCDGIEALWSARAGAFLWPPAGWHWPLRSVAANAPFACPIQTFSKSKREARIKVDTGLQRSNEGSLTSSDRIHWKREISLIQKTVAESHE